MANIVCFFHPLRRDAFSCQTSVKTNFCQFSLYCGEVAGGPSRRLSGRATLRDELSQDLWREWRTSSWWGVVGIRVAAVIWRGVADATRAVVIAHNHGEKQNGVNVFSLFVPKVEDPNRSRGSRWRVPVTFLHWTTAEWVRRHCGGQHISPAASSCLSAVTMPTHAYINGVCVHREGRWDESSSFVREEEKKEVSQFGSLPG